MRASIRIARQPSPLPVQLTSLLGREREANQLCALLTDPTHRIVTITGPGGVGKTRLALHVAATLQETFEDGVASVQLAAARDPNFVVPAIAQAFGVYGDTRDAPEDILAEVLHDRRLLLVLDNFEQLLDAAPSLVGILARCPGTTMLVTSQAPLGVSGEQLYPLHPLATPPAEHTAAVDILQSDAVALFVQRARSVNPDLAVDERTAGTIAEICRKLDGLPLAIELAAARTNILSPDALLARLSNRLQVLSGTRRGVPDRLRTMRHAISWSYDLLTPDEQALFRRMAVFAGGISLGAVESIAEPAESGRDAVDLLGGLVDHSLVQLDPRPSGEVRYLMLETIRDYGLEQLELRGETDEARLAHAICMMEVSEEAEPHLTGSDQKAWINRLDPDTENLRAAVDWSLEHGQEEITLRIGASNWRFCSIRGLAADCLNRLERAIAAPACARSPYRATALVGAGNLARDLHDLEKARGYFERGRQLANETSNASDECHAMLGLGEVENALGNYSAAMTWHQQAQALAHEIGDRRSVAMAIRNMAAAFRFHGRLDDAERCLMESRAILNEVGDTAAEAMAWSCLGFVSFERGDFERAEELLTQALELQRDVMASRDLPFTLVGLGQVWCRLGDFSRAQDAFTEAIALFRQAANTVMGGVALTGVATLKLYQDDLPQATTLVLESTRIVARAGDQQGLLSNTDVLAAICSRSARHASAVELAAAAAAIRERRGVACGPLMLADRRRIETAARAALGDRAYASAWQAGRRLGLDDLAQRIDVIGREVIDPRQPQSTPPDAGGQDGAQVGGGATVIEHPLTARETEVLQLLAQGLSTQEVADALSISPRTVATHLTSILAKLCVSSRTAAVAYAMRAGIV